MTHDRYNPKTHLFNQSARGRKEIRNDFFIFETLLFVQPQLQFNEFKCNKKKVDVQQRPLWVSNFKI